MSVHDSSLVSYDGLGQNTIPIIHLDRPQIQRIQSPKLKVLAWILAFDSNSLCRMCVWGVWIVDFGFWLLDV